MQSNNPPPPHPPPTLIIADQDPRRGDPSESDVLACALRCGPQGAPGVADGVHADDEIQGRDVMENTGPGVAQECLTPHSGGVAEALFDQGSPVRLAQHPPQVLLGAQDSEMSSPNMQSSLGAACTVMAPSESSTDGSQLSNSPPSGKKAMPGDPNPMPAAKRVRLGVVQAIAIEIDNRDQKLDKDPLKAKAGRDRPTFRRLKLRLAPDEYTAGACFFFCSCLEPPCFRSQTPLTGVDVRVEATIMYKERCGIEVKESALGVCRALEVDTWDDGPWGGFATPFSTSCHLHRWEACADAYKHTKNNGFKVWPRHCCDVCCSLSVGSTWYRSWLVPVFGSLSDCLCHEQCWQWCPVCDRKVLQDGGDLAMGAQVLHVFSQGQSVRVRTREGMRGRSLGRPSNTPPCGCGGDLQEAIVLSSLLFNKWAPLHVHNQQLHSLTVDHEFVVVNGYHWSLRAMVLHIGATREEGHFVIHILARDEWWPCDEASVTKGRPLANSRKVTFLLYERTATEMVGLSQGGSQRGACNHGARDAPS